ncbi:MAG TPA: cohesin domain-containing protein [Bacteroidales bacterium]|nr:cohesin domain-containing protein [Bacteroidales bacterium]
MKKLFFNIVFLLLISFSCSANVTFLMGNQTAAEGTQVMVPVKVVDFASIVSAQGTVQFDQSVISFVSVQDFGLATLDESSFGISQAANGKLMFSWTDPDLGGESLPDSAVLFTIRFNVIGISGQSSALSFVNVPTAMEVMNNSFDQETLSLINGSVTIQNMVLPSAVTLKLDSVSGIHGSQVTVSCRAFNFSNINSAQGTILFDNTVVSFDGIGYCGLPGLNAASFGLTQLSQGKITFSWNDPDLEGRDIANGEAVFSLNFVLTGNTGQHSNISLTDTPTQVEISDSSLNLLSVGLIGGDIRITGSSGVLGIKIDSVIGTPGFQVVVPVRVWQFKKIVSLQGTITFNPAVALFDTVVQYGLPFMDFTTFGTSLINTGKLMFSWTDDSYTGQTLSDSSVIFAVRFTVAGNEGSFTLLDMISTPTSIEVVDTSLSELSFYTQQGKIMVGTGHTLSGKTRYAGRANAGSPAPNPPSYNADTYTIGKVIVILKTYPEGDIITKDTSDALGNFHFSNVMDGTYRLSYDKYTADSMQWGNDVNAIDVALLKYFIGSDTIQDPSRCFSAKYKRAANVDNNAAINAVDIARLKSKIGAPYDAVKNFPKGNWPALDTVVTMSGADFNVLLKTICYGDFNASSSRYRDSLTTWSNLKSVATDIVLTSEESLVTSDPHYFEVPLRISEKMNEFSALGLELTYSKGYELVSAFMPGSGNDKGPVKINQTLDEVIAENNDLLVTDEDGVIRVVYATTDHYDVSANDVMIVFGFRKLMYIDQETKEFNLAGTGVIGNKYGEENENTYLLMPKVLVQGSNTEAGLEFTGYPNPFKSQATINYTLPENGTVTLKVYNAIGGLISELVNEVQESGKHTVPFSQESLSSGMYTFKLEYISGNKSNCLVLKMFNR